MLVYPHWISVVRAGHRGRWWGHRLAVSHGGCHGHRMLQFGHPLNPEGSRVGGSEASSQMGSGSTRLQAPSLPSTTTAAELWFSSPPIFSPRIRLVHTTHVCISALGDISSHGSITVSVYGGHAKALQLFVPHFTRRDDMLTHPCFVRYGQSPQASWSG